MAVPFAWGCVALYVLLRRAIINRPLSRPGVAFSKQPPRHLSRYFFSGGGVMMGDASWTELQKNSSLSLFTYPV